MQVSNSSAARPWKLEQNTSGQVSRQASRQASRASSPWKLKQNNMTKKGSFFGPQNVRKSRRAKMGLPAISDVLFQASAIESKRKVVVLIKKDGGEMLIAIVLDRPIAEAKASVNNSEAFVGEITKIMQNEHAHPVIAQMIHPDVRDDLRSAQPAHQEAVAARWKRCNTRRVLKLISRATCQRGIPTAGCHTDFTHHYLH